jgi:hypothetical protein
MNINWKRIAALIGFVSAVLIFGYGIYFFFLKPAVPGQSPIGGTQTPPIGGLPTTGTGGEVPILPQDGSGLPLGPGTAAPSNPSASPAANGGLTQATAISPRPAQGLTISSDGNNAIYYDRTDGLFYRVSPEGQLAPLTDQVFNSVENITWDSNGSKAVLEYPDGSNIVYDFQSNKQYTLPKHWKDYDFSPNSDQLVFKSIGSSPENSWLAIANTDGSQATRVEHLGDKDANVYPLWSPGNQIVAMFSEGRNFDRQDLYFVGKNQENLRSVTIEGRGFQGKWSPQGNQLVYSVYSSASNYKPTLWVVDAQPSTIGTNRKSLRIQTWAEKCSFANNTTLYCAVPRELRDGAGIFNEDLDTSPTNIYKIDITTGNHSLVAIPDGNPNISNIVVPQNESYLFYTNKNDGRMYRVNLK